MSEHLQSFFAGRWRDASGPKYHTEYPHDGSTVAHLHAATQDDVEQAIEVAEQARQRANWAGLKRHERAAILYRIGAMATLR